METIEVVLLSRDRQRVLHRLSVDTRKVGSASLVMYGQAYFAYSRLKSGPCAEFVECDAPAQLLEEATQ